MWCKVTIFFRLFKAYTLLLTQIYGDTVIHSYKL